MYSNNPDSQNDLQNLALLQHATEAPSEACLEDPETRAAFEEGLRQLAEDIVQFHPSIAHVLLGMSEEPIGTIHGQN